MRNGRSHGFTLMELAAVVAILSLIAAFGMPTYDMFVRRARTAEARAVLESLAHAELAYRRDHRRFLELPPNPPPAPGAQPHAAVDNAQWRELGMPLRGDYWFQYSTEYSGGAWLVVARGDQNGDGLESRFTINLETLKLSTTDELE
ncbi:MAG: prepilin-type N-terminal cleavage/methylation domain-containing protein [Myxococcota bacterium]